MAYTEKELQRLAEIKETIYENNRRLGFDPETRATYRDIPCIRELEAILAKHTEADDRVDDLFVLELLADTHRNMGRSGIAARYYMLFAYLAGALLQEAPDEGIKERLCDVVYNAACERNKLFGIDDECADLLSVVIPVLGEEKSAQLVADGSADVSLKVDPVEVKREYQGAIDEVERKLDEEFGTEIKKGMCHSIWARKKQLLAEHGVEWRTPAELYPDAIFD